MTTKEYCSHCGLPCLSPIEMAEHTFCCIGCKSVWLALSHMGLSAYYEIRDRFSLAGFVPTAEASEGYLYFDDPLVTEKAIVKDQNNMWHVDFYIPEIYCAACVWLLEKLPSCNKGILSSKVNLSNKKLHILFNPEEIKLSEVVRIIKNFGYSVEIAEDQDFNQSTWNKEELSRLAVAIFSAMNCMMIAVSLYQGWWSGMDQNLKIFLEVISAVVSFPAVFYSAKPFTMRALSGLRSGRVSLDVPLALGILAGYVFSICSIIFSLGEVYFDSISVLIALLLLARFGTNFTVSKYRKKGSMIKSVFPEYAFRKDQGSNSRFVEVFAQRLNPGDICKVKTNSSIPADAKILEGSLLIDSSVLSGEADPVEVSKGALVWGGTKVLSGEGIIVLEKNQHSSRFFSSLSKLTENVELGSELIEKINRRSSLFVTWVFAVTSVSFIYFLYTSGFLRAYEVALSIVVISCPCALGISVPFVFTSACMKAAREGIYFASGGVIEKTALCDNIIVDKTGTITEGTFSEIQFESFVDEEKLRAIFQKVYFLEFDQPHPIAKRISNLIAEYSSISMRHTTDGSKVSSGTVISGSFSDDTFIEIGSKELLKKYGVRNESSRYNHVKATTVYVFENGVLVLVFYLTDKVRQGMYEEILSLGSHGYSFYMLSGDQSSVVNSVAEDLGFNSSQVFAEMKPEDKEQRVRSLGSGTLMVGDGLNDVLALKAATVGVSVTGGLELLQKVGGVLITDFSADKLSKLVLGARSTVRAAHLNVGFSYVYNLTGTLIAAAGYVSPLVAAVLMPISSAVVVSIALYFPKFKRAN